MNESALVRMPSKNSMTMQMRRSCMNAVRLDLGFFNAWMDRPA